MAKLTLWFTDETDLTLEKAFFCTPAGTERWSIRGRTAGAYRGFETFQWTNAVQGIAILALRSAATGSAIIQGHSGSPASTLDYAISKGPLWLLDLFGTDAAGNSFAKRLFRRSNPERKRAGPVTVGFNENVLKPGDITIMIRDLEVRDSALLLRAADIIEERFYAKDRGAPRVRPVLQVVSQQPESSGVPGVCQPLEHSCCDEPLWPEAA